MGSADIVPGVSGGTIAFILGVYEELVYSIKVASGKALKQIIKGDITGAFKTIPFAFLVPLGAGILTALVTLASLISNLLDTQPVYIWSFFFGLVVASVFIVSKRVRSWTTTNFISLIIAAAGAYMLVGAVPVDTPATPLAFFLSGAIAIIAMILPGVSGSFLLVIMGKYYQILEAVVQRDVVSLGLVAAGAVIGLAMFSRLLSWLFARHHDLVIAILTGFMIGSLRKIWPWKMVTSTYIDSHGEELALTSRNILPEVFDSTVMIAVVLAVAAAGLIMYLETLSVTHEKTEDVESKAFEKEHKKAVGKK